jgi:ubiquinone/menaquinone biosynthesis C-methylase UbiE
MQALAAALALVPGATLADLGCGMGGPGLWIARETQARLVGIDISTVALDHARARALAVGMSERARYTQGTFDNTGLDTASVDGAMSVDAFQYAPDKQAALHEIARILRPGARLALVCFELAPERLAGVPILGADPIADYGPLLEQAGFEVERYEETPNWHTRVTRTYEALTAARRALTSEMGEAAANALLGEITLTLQLEPYRRRVFVVGKRR